MIENFMSQSISQFDLKELIPFVVIWFIFIVAMFKICIIINDGFKICNNIKNDLQEFINKAKNVSFLEKSLFLNFPTLSNIGLRYTNYINFEKKESYISSKEFFNADTLIEDNDPKKNLRKALQNIIPSIGLLCTFTFILLGLFGIDPDKIGTINKLIQSLSSKFATSVISLLIAVIFIWIEKSKYSDLKVKCIEVQKILLDQFPLVTQTDLLVGLNSKLETLIKGQAEALSSTNTNLDRQSSYLDTVNKQLDRQLNSLDNVNTQLCTQIQTLNTFAENIQNNSIESLNQMVKTFQSTLSENTTKQFQEISEVITNLSSTIEMVYEYQETYTENMKQTNEIAENSLEKQKESSIIIENIIRDINGEVNNYKELISQNNEMISQSNDIVSKLSDITGELAYAGEQFNEAAPSVNSIRESVSELTENLNKSIEQFNHISNEFSIDKFTMVIEKFKKGIKESLEEIQAGLNDDAEIVRGNLAWYDEQLNRLIEGSKEVIEKVHNSMSEYSEQTNIFLDRYIDTMRQTITFLNNHVEELDNSMKNNLSNLSNNFTNLNNTLSLIDTQMQEREVNAEG